MSRLLTHWRLTGRSEAFSAKVRLIDDRVESGAAQRYAQGSAENARGLCEIKFLTGATSFYSFNFTKKL